MGFGFEMRPQMDHRHEKKKKILAAIAREKKTFPLEQERIGLYRQLVGRIFDALPEDEQEEFVDDPIEFRSRQLLFRGLDHEKTRQFLKDEKLSPQPGQYGGEAVFFSDSPLGAASFMPPDGSLVIVDRDDAVYLDKKKGASDISDKDFKKEVRDYIDALPESERKMAQYSAHNRWDTTEPYSAGRGWKIIALRSEQPLGSVKEMLVPDLKQQEVHSMDPKDEMAMDELRKIFDEKEKGG